MQKILVIGPQLSGKTTLVRYIRSNKLATVSEIDEEILAANGGVWPKDDTYKDTVLVPQIYKKISKYQDIVFFANYFSSIEHITLFKNAGFKVVLLQLDYEQLLSRNKHRMHHEGYDDATRWLQGQLENHAKLMAAGYVDQTLDGTLSTKKLAEHILKR